jgi:hypothetical protein
MLLTSQHRMTYRHDPSKGGSVSPRWQLPSADPSIAVRDYEEQLGALSSPRHRKMLETLIEHVRTVLVCDLEGVMRTMAAEPEFRTWGATGDTGRKGAEAVRSGYAMAFARPGGAITNQVNKVERFVIDDHTVALELTETRVWPARIAKEQGYSVPTDDGYYAVRRRCAVLIPYDDQALICGEYNYGFGWPADPLNFEPVADDDLSPEYLAWLRAMESEQR